MIRPIAAAETCVGHRRAGIGGVNKLAVSCVDTDMSDGAAVSGEENQITGKKARFGYICTVGVLGFRGAVRCVAQRFENIIDKTGAVKTGRRSTAIYIGDTKIFLSFGNYALSGEG